MKCSKKILNSRSWLVQGITSNDFTFVNIVDRNNYLKTKSPFNNFKDANRIYEYARKYCINIVVTSPMFIDCSQKHYNELLTMPIEILE